MTHASLPPPESYGQALTISAQRKLRAVSLLAEAGDDAVWRASVLLHDARRIERRALRVLEAPSPETRLRSVVEQCGCLVDGRDPTMILEVAWGDVLEASLSVSVSVAASLRRRLDPRVDALFKEYVSEARNALGFFQWYNGAEGVHAGEGKQRLRTIEKQAQRLLHAFPGDPRLWGAASMLQRTLGNHPEAWQAIRRGRELDPEDSNLMGFELTLAPDVLPVDRARAFLDAAYAAAASGSTSMDVCLPLASSLLEIAQRESDPRPWEERARYIATLGQGLPPLNPHDHKLCRFIELAARELLAGRIPSVDLLFRVGLGFLVPGILERDRGDLLGAVRALARPMPNLIAA